LHVTSWDDWDRHGEVGRYETAAPVTTNRSRREGGWGMVQCVAVRRFEY
jgi:hypothetical protein